MQSKTITIKFTKALAGATVVAAAFTGVAMGAFAFGGSGADESRLAFDQLPPVTAAAHTQPARTRQVARPAQVKRAVSKQPTGTSFLGKLSLDNGLVKLKVLRVAGGAEGSQSAALLLGRRAVLQLGNVRLVDRSGARLSLALADKAIVQVHGRLLPQGAWRWSDEELRPVIRAEHIVVLRLEPRDWND